MSTSKENFKLLSTRLVANFKEEEFSCLSQLIDSVEPNLYNLFCRSGTMLFENLLYAERNFNMNYDEQCFITPIIIQLKFSENLVCFKNILISEVEWYGATVTRFFIDYFSLMYHEMISALESIMAIKECVDHSELSAPFKAEAITKFEYFKEIAELLTLALRNTFNVIHELNELNSDPYLTLDTFELKINPTVLAGNTLVSNSLSQRALIYTKMLDLQGIKLQEFRLKNLTDLDLSLVTGVYPSSPQHATMFCDYVCAINKPNRYAVIVG